MCHVGCIAQTIWELFAAMGMWLTGNAPDGRIDWQASVLSPDAPLQRSGKKRWQVAWLGVARGANPADGESGSHRLPHWSV